MWTKAKQQALDSLHFSAERHLYTYKGMRVPSVTQVIDQLTAATFQGIPLAMLEDARIRGTKVHELTAMDDDYHGEDPQPYEHLSGYLRAWRSFKQDSGAEILATEQRVFNARYRYAGTLDRVARLEGGLSIIDIKTGMPFPEHGLQTAAYLEAANEGRVGEKITKRFTIRLLDSGSYKVVEYKEKSDFPVFLAAMTLYQWRNRDGKAS